MTRNINIGPDRYNVWNEYNLKTLTRNNWRASLVPATAVIPAPIVYMKVAAVKKLVVGFRIACILQSTDKVRTGCRLPFLLQEHGFSGPVGPLPSPSGVGGKGRWGCPVADGLQIVYFEKIRVFKAGVT